uniref:CD8+ T cell target antigen Tp2 n=1 Tax=Theileria parva TaxID=5875 RepID=F6LWM5_THEPA|nr:CD8+ T cell target antigen Tp2 [Theileria parva]
MKLAARLISLYFIIFILPSKILRDQCTPPELEALGRLLNSDPDRETLFKTSKAMTMTGRKHGIRPGTSKEKLTRELTKLLRSIGIVEVSDKCLECFGASIQCVVKNCRGDCIKGPCTSGCQNCVKTKCKPKMLECIGTSDVPNPCEWECEYLKYKLPETGEDESEKKGEASGTS